MYSKVFLGSIFTGLTAMRDTIWREVQKRRFLKCISFQPDHLARGRSAVDVMREIDNELASSDFFIFLIGPDYGTKIRNTGLASQSNREYWQYSFGEYELRCVMDRLQRDQVDPRRILLVELTKKSPITHLPWNDHWSGVNKFKTYVHTQAMQYNIPRHAVPVQRDRGQYNVRTRGEDTWVQLIETFLNKADAVAEREERSKCLRAFRIDRQVHVHVAGWSGIQEEILYEKFARRYCYESDSFSFLTMDRSIIELPSSTRYFPRLSHDYLTFDFLFSDIEIVKFHRDRDYIENIKPFSGGDIVNSFFNSSKFSPLIMRYRDQCYDGENLYAVPLLYGFNEIIVGKDVAVADGDQPSTYANFDLSLLIADGVDIGLWGWWVVTFPIILQAHIARLFKENPSTASYFGATNRDIMSVQAFSRWFRSLAASNPSDFERTIQLMTDSVILHVKESVAKTGHRAGIKILRTLASLRYYLMEAHNSVVLGGTSGVLATIDQPVLPLRCVIPKEGLYMWINCVCATSLATGEMLGKIIEHWLDADTQLKMSLGADGKDIGSKQYIGIPTNLEAQRNFEDRSKELPSLKPICDTIVLQKELTAGKPSLNTALRPFPAQAAFLMEYYWNYLISGLNAEPVK